MVHEDDDKTAVRQSLPSVMMKMRTVAYNQQSKKFSVINAKHQFLIAHLFQCLQLLSDLQVSELAVMRCQCKQLSTLSVDPEIHVLRPRHSHTLLKISGLDHFVITKVRYSENSRRSDAASSC